MGAGRGAALCRKDITRLLTGLGRKMANNPHQACSRRLNPVPRQSQACRRESQSQPMEEKQATRG